MQNPLRHDPLSPSTRTAISHCDTLSVCQHTLSRRSDNPSRHSGTLSRCRDMYSRGTHTPSASRDRLSRRHVGLSISRVKHSDC